MKLKLTLYFYLLVIFLCNSQVKSTLKLRQTLSNLNTESIYIHTNSDKFIAGQEIKYKIYPLLKNNTPSNISKFINVIFLNEENNIISSEKVSVINNSAQGSIKTQTNLNTGMYKIIVYTNWMLNNANFFQRNILIKNSFTRHLKTVKTPKYNSITNVNTNKKATLLGTFSKRRKVQLNTNDILEKGNYSVSATLYSKLPEINYNPINFQQNSYLKTKKQEDNIYLPEIRGIVISGRIEHNDSKEEKTTVALSITQKKSMTYVTETDKKGNFIFIVDKPYENNKAYIYPISRDTSPKKIIVDSIYKPSLNTTTKNATNYIEVENYFAKNELLYAQIENAYKEIKKDSIIFTQNINQTFQKFDKEYILNDFKKFKTVKETIVEVIDDVWIEKNNNKYYFKVRKNNSLEEEKRETLLIIDGVIVNNHNDIINYKSKNIRKISFNKDEYIINGKIYNGLLFFNTFKGDYTPLENNSINLFTLTSLGKTKKHFHPDYSKSKYERTPDYRTNLYWNPNLTNNQKIEFYTSDVKGKYKIEIQGFTSKGKPIHLNFFFNVN